MSYRIRRLVSATVGTLTDPFLRTTRRGRVRAVILAYHRIGTAGDSPLDRALWNASVTQFTEQISWLQKRADIVPLLELPGLVRRPRTRSVAITFDDGYGDNFETAFPILKAAGVPATFFVSTGFVDHPSTPWWDEIAWIVRTTSASEILLPGSDQPIRLLEGDRAAPIRSVLRHVKKMTGNQMDAFITVLASQTGTGRIPETARPPWLSWGQLREMQEMGMSIGGHTVSHPVLSRLKREEQRAELRTSLARLTIECGEIPRAMSYPVGGPGAYDATTRFEAREAGYVMACNYHGGYVTQHIEDLFDMPRIAMQPYTRMADLATAYSWPRWLMA